MPTSTPWDIYAQQLFPLGYGYPLWIPEPSIQDRSSTPNLREVHIGDVGYLREGGFYPLFNSTRSESDPFNTLGVPTGFIPLDTTNVLIRSHRKLAQGRLCSEGVQMIQASGELGGSSGAPSISANVGFEFEFRTNSGAFVMLDPPALSTDIHSRNAIVTYMRNNIDNWLEFANSTWNLGLKEDEIVFISGTTKTSRWAVAAFQGDSFSSKRGFVSGEFGPFAKAALSVNISNHMLPAQYYRHGPLTKRDDTPSSVLPPSSYDLSDVSALSSRGLPEDQCIFVHYYKMKRRRLWSWKGPMQAAAGPHDLPPLPDDTEDDSNTSIRITDSPQSVEESMSGTERGEAYDPVNDLLKYILTESDAEIALASTLDLAELFEVPPHHISDALRDPAPVIEVDESSTGQIASTIHLDNKERGERSHKTTHTNLKHDKLQEYKGHHALTPEKSYVVILNDTLQEMGNVFSLSWHDTFTGEQFRVVWTSSCKLNGEVIATGSGASKSIARNEAAKDGLQFLANKFAK